MLIGVISDTHDNMPKIGCALSILQERGAETIVHAGDFVAPFALKALLGSGIPVVGVFGNNDGERAGLNRQGAELHEPPHQFTLGDRSVVVSHDEESLSDRDAAEADIVVCGHTHTPEVRGSDRLRINPGEAGGWLSGRSTMAVVALDSLEAEIIDLGPQETLSI